jgi:hypothetical protein
MPDSLFRKTDLPFNTRIDSRVRDQLDALAKLSVAVLGMRAAVAACPNDPTQLDKWTHKLALLTDDVCDASQWYEVDCAWEPAA